MTTERIEFNVIIGGNRGHAQVFDDLLIQGINGLAGGCTVTYPTGYWRPVETSTAPTPSENCIQVQFSMALLVRWEYQTTVYRVREIIRDAAKRVPHGHGIDWVHFTSHAVEANHFQINP